MDSPRIEADVIDLVRRVGALHADAAVGRDSSIALDLAFDSVRVLELVCEIEERFDITVPLNELTSVRTVGDIVDRVQAHAESAQRRAAQ
jgi:acyl carrier protein